jgi:signal transduction histidine kinase
MRLGSVDRRYYERDQTMKLRTKLALFSVTTIAASTGILGWGVSRFVLQQFEQQQRAQSETLANQFHREFAHKGDEVVYAVQDIAEAESTLRMAIDLSRPQADPSLYAHDAQGIATSRQLDFFEIAADDGTLISSAQWPGRIGFKNDWVTQPIDWNQQAAFLSRVELPDQVDLGLLCVRTVNVGQKKLYLIGGRKMDADFLQALVIPAEMQVLFYPNLETAFVPEALQGSLGRAEAPERFAGLIGSLQAQPRTAEFQTPGIKGLVAGQKFTALPLTGRNNELLAAVLVGSASDAVSKTAVYIRNSTISVGAAALLLALIFSFSVSAQVSRPLARLEKAARELAAGDWKAKVEVRGRSEVARAARAFNDMSVQLSAKRDKQLQAERVGAWRELARNFALELKVPLFSLQLTLENLARARQKTPERFDQIFAETMRMADGEMENLKEIIARFSDFAKLRQPRMQAVNVNDVLRATVNSFESAFHARGRPPVKPELVLDENAPKAWGDPELLYKGFENVIANSLNAMPMGGTLTIRAARQNGHVRVEISDTASTLQAEEPLPAMHYTPKREGAGLGLATIQTVVSDHGGQMFVEAIPGTGTVFRMDFPIAPTSVRGLQPENTTGTPKRQPKTEQLKAEQPKPEQAHSDRATMDAAQAGQPKLNEVKIDEGKIDPDEVDQTKREPAEVEQPVGSAVRQKRPFGRMLDI